MERLAIAITRAAQIREESFDKEALEKRKGQKTSKYYPINTKQFYKISLWDACDRAATEVGFTGQMTLPLYLLLDDTWNDILDWANTVIKFKG